MFSIKFKIFFVFIILVAVVIILQKFLFINDQTIKIKIGDSIFTAEIVKTDAQKTKGLSGRSHLDAGKGMLFIFNEPDFYSFWMKDMKFPIDIIWMRDNEIIGFVENVPPDNSSSPKIYSPSKLVNKVLEIPAGSIAKIKF